MFIARASSLAFKRTKFGTTLSPLFQQSMNLSWAKSDSVLLSFDERVNVIKHNILPQVATQKGVEEVHVKLEQSRDGVALAMKLRDDVSTLLIDARSTTPEYGFKKPDLLSVDAVLRKWLRTVFCLSSLQLKRVEFGASSGHVLEYVSKAESVHKFTALKELKRRLHDGRRCLAFFHPCIEELPVAFIHIGLTSQVATSLSALNTYKDEETPSCAMFYSVNAPLNSLSGLDLATLLIKEAATNLAANFPTINTFCTLSPIPDFVAWIRGPLFTERALVSMPESYRNDILDVLASRSVPVALNEQEKREQAVDALKELASRDPMVAHVSISELQEPLLWLCGQYLMKNKLPNGLPYDPVTRFHTRNGASLLNINWMGNPSDAGIQTSMGMMANYLYDVPNLTDNAHAFSETQVIPASDRVHARVQEKN